MALLNRVGPDTLGSLERAMRQRGREAAILEAAGASLAAVYLYGYAFEMRLKGSYYRMLGLVPASDTHTAWLTAEATISSLPGLPALNLAGQRPGRGHNVLA